MRNISKKYTIKIPKDITILYCNKKKIITVIGPIKKKSLKLNVQIELISNKKTIEVSSVPFSTMSNNLQRKLKSIQGTTTALLKQMIIETSSVIYQKLKFIGVGYRAFDVQNSENKLLQFKLGYSHSVYFKAPSNLNIFCLKMTKLFIYGTSYQKITQTSARIQSYKKPEPYKGKGILYENQNIKLKEGKKA